MLHQSKRAKPVTVMVGAYPAWSLRDCFEGLSTLALHGVVWLSLLLLVVTEIMAVSVIILYPQHTIVVWWHQSGWLVGERIIALVIFTLGAALMLAINTKQAVKEWMGLVALMRATSDHLSAIPLSDYIHVSMPSWLRRSQKVEIPDDAYTSFVGNLGTKEPWVEKLREFLEIREAEDTSPLSILLTLRDRITVTVRGKNGRKDEFTLYQQHTAAMVGLLALQEKNAWVSRSEIVEKIYGGTPGNVNTHKHRMKDHLTKAIMRVSDQAERTQDTSTADAQHNKWNMIEYDDSRKENLWRLSSAIHVSIFPELDTVLNQLKCIHNSADPTLDDLEALHTNCDKMMAKYGKGLFSYYHRKKHRREYWHWAKAYYTHYQETALSVLEQTAKHVVAYAEKKKQDSPEFHASIRQAAQLSVWTLDVALGIVPHLPEAEKALSTALAFYRSLGDVSSARKAFHTFAVYMLLRDEKWQPSASLKDIWPRAIKMPEGDELSY